MKVNTKNMKCEKIKLINQDDYTVFVNIYNQNEKDEDVEKILIACHGFDSNKQGGTIAEIVEQSQNDKIVIISFDWPLHGESEEPLLIKNCIRDFYLIYQYIIKRYPNSEKNIFGSSFGAYMILQFLKAYPNTNLKKIFFKSPAIKMEKVFKEVLLEEELESFEKKGYTIKNRNKKMKITYKFYEELLNMKITSDNIVKDKSIIIFHGTEDEVSLPKDIEEYECCNIKIKKLKGAPHSFKGKYLDEMIQTILKYIKS